MAVGLEAQGRLKIGRPVAIIDIGSNSVRLVVYEGMARALTPIYNEKVLCGLGRHVATTGRLDDDAVERALRALARFKVLCETMHVSEVYVLATAAARDASNGPAFLEAATLACGREINLLSGAKEAQLSALGVVSGFHAPDGIVGDMGGGSLELVDVNGFSVGEGVTMPLGGLALQDLSGGSLKKAQKIVRAALARAPEYLEKLQGRTFYAVGGTWRAVARLHQAARDYPLHVMHGYVINPDDGLDFLHLVEEVDTKALKDIESIAEARRPLLVYGAILLEEIIRLGRPKEVAISAHGVREGLLFDKLDEQTRRRDPLLSAAGALNLLRSRSPRHGEELCGWTDAFIESLGLPETETEYRLRHAACLLADIGWRAHPDYRGEQSLNLIAYGAFVGLDHPGRAYLALSIFFRHEGLSPDKVGSRIKVLAGSRLMERARLLAAMMRIAYPVSVAMGGILPQAPLVARNGQVVLRLPSAMEALANERLSGRVRALGKILNLEPSIEILR
ncbi:exopolyphosphatase [Microvirga alba]|uniref:exopolyphosphatase n=1 Tax=Microvirga alba TaxID=2791025 RepID=A0A931FNI2_9HYPH|nr:exopolyphosphatase [Microvirga alba]MBF9232357.1 exopolyphosphatase [Microvirga alba]